MKILMLSPNIYPNSTGGMEIYNYHFVQQISKMGEDIRLLTRKGNRVEGIKQYRLYSGNPTFQSFQIICHFFFHKYDIVHVPYTSNSFIASPILKYKKMNHNFKYVIYIHGGGMYKWKDSRIHKGFFENAKEVIAISGPMVEEYSSRVNKKIRKILPLIPFGEPSDDKINLRSKFSFKPDEKIMINVGSIKPIKGSDFLVESLIKLGKEYFQKNKLKMIFIGDGILKEKLESKIFDNEMTSEILFWGKKKREEIPDLLEAADIFINASHFEGAPLSIIEALLRGKIIISSSVSGINNIITDKYNGMLYEKEDFDQFSKALDEVISDKLLAEKISINAMYEAEKKFNYKSCYSQHLALYK